MSFFPHTRQLGAQPGVQLNPLRDNTDGFVADASDQVAAIVGRFKRGRIDAPFKVNRGNLNAKLGLPESTRISLLNEAHVQLYEAVNSGTYEAVVARLITAAAVNSFAVFNVNAGVSAFTVAAAAPVGAYVLYLQHLGCFNDGIKLEVSANKVLDADGVTAIPAKVITLRVREPNGALMYEFTGSLDPLSVDEFGKDNYIGAKIAEQTDEFTIGVAAGASIAVTADCYGKNTDGSAKVAATATPLILFAENGTGYTTSDYDAAIAKLENGSVDFGTIISGGSQAVALLSKLGLMAVRANRQFVFDIPGSLTPAAAIAFINQLNLDTHYCQAYWAPLLTDDPANGGKAIIGTSGFNVGRRCARNAQTNSYGLAPKNYPIGGKEWPLVRTGIKQLCNPTEFELSDLANAKINPVLFEKYNGGGKFVFTDVLTCAKVASSYRKLISVAEMSATIDDMVAKFGKEIMILPMELAIKRTNDFLKFLFDGCRASGWLVASNDEQLGDKGYTFTVQRNGVRPADRLDIDYGLHYDGVVRAVYITQTLSR